MYNIEDILARLAAGEDANDIATEFTNALNAAVQEDAKTKAAEKKELEKLQDAQHMVDTVLDFVDKWYPELGTETVEVDAAEIIDAIDQMINELKPMVQLLSKLNKIEPVKVKVAKKTGDPFSAFFKANNI